MAELQVVCSSAHAGHLVVLLRDPDNGPAAIPTAPLSAGEEPELHASRVAQELFGRAAAGVISAGALSLPDHDAIALTFAAIIPAGREAPPGWVWRRLSRNGTVTPPVDTRAARAIEFAVRALRERMDLEPIAFRLLATTFTLSELQQLYELLLGRKLHKASFRRSLAAAELVQPVDEWRTEGRGRPAQLYRYAPRRARGRQERPVRFELLR